MAPTLPSLYLPHGGGPCFFMEWTAGPADTWDKLAAWLSSVAGTLAQPPKSILIISAHWEEDQFTVTGHPQPPLLFDYYGFPEHTYQLQYPAPGSPELAEKVCELLEPAGLPARIDAQRGFDHGVFVPFKLIYPEANIPVVQLSLKSGLDPVTHLKAGWALRSLREQGVLIAGSGMSYHNLRGFFSGAQATCDPFDRWLTDAACSSRARRVQLLAEWSNAPCARLAHPREEHLLPLMVAAGAAGDDPGTQVFGGRIMGELVSAYQFGR